MSEFRRLTHVFYKCDYHIVFTPKFRCRVLDSMVKSLMEHDIQVVSEWKNVIIEELNLQKDHVHMVCSIPSKVSISEYMGILKGKLAIKFFKNVSKFEKEAILGQSFLVKGILY